MIRSLARILSITATVVSLALARPYGLDLETPTSSQLPHFPWADPPPYNSSVRPLVLWHGLGDSAHSAGMLEFAELCRGVHPGMFVHNIYIYDDLEKDQQAGFFGNAWEQLEIVNAQLNNITELKNGFDAIGFSQGGQFLRAYAEKYNDPPIKNLITFGSQHMGVSDIPTCRPGDALCQLARLAARRGVYSAYAQSHLIQAQYFRDPKQLPRFLRSNTFLTLLNGEVGDEDETGRTRNVTFKENFKQLESLVLILFDKDTTVVPRESSWFGSVAPPSFKDGVEASGWGDPVEIIPMRMQPLYTHDWIGLRALDEAGRVTLLSCAGEHMQITRECWEPIIQKYTGSTVSPPTSKSWRPSLPGLVVQS